MPPSPTLTIYTLGHSNHPADRFLALLRRHGIAHLVDVRSHPTSRFNPHFRRTALAALLHDAGIGYTWLGDAMGGRPKDPALYDAGQARPNLDRQRQTPAYQEGIARLLAIAAAEPAVILCSEGDPAQCHRTWLITPTLLERGATVLHIYPDGHLEPAADPAP